MKYAKVCSYFLGGIHELIVTLGSVAVVLLTVFISCAVYVNDYYHAEETAIAAMAVEDNYTVEEYGGNIAFIPNEPIA